LLDCLAYFFSADELKGDNIYSCDKCKKLGCHHGTAGSGHYTCYCYLPPTDSWYEYNDSIVREVDSQTVLNSEAYVLFYRKESLGRLFNLGELSFISVLESWKRSGGKVDRLTKQHSKVDSVVTSYISTMWLSKLYTLAEQREVEEGNQRQ
jgi:ubiquitin carboxyl-terminal hydrolase 20/33